MEFYNCPKCGYKMYWKEIHADTDINDIVLYCAGCGFRDDEHEVK